MRYQLTKAWRDVLAGGSRSLLVIFALSLGLWGLGSVVISFRILAPDLQRNFLGTDPPHAVVTLERPRSIDPVSLLASQATRVRAAEYRDLGMARIEVKSGEWIPLWLSGVEDFGHFQVARLASESGSFVPRAGAMVIERNCRLISNLDTGATARVRSGSRRLEIPVAGVVFDPAQAPATQDHFVYGYADRATWAGITGQESGRRLLIRFNDVHSKADVEKAVAALSLPAGSAVQVPPFEQHPHQWQLNLLLGIIAAIGSLSFLLSSLMVSQAVAALLAKQVKQIGILKAIGASRIRIAGLYALYLLVFAVFAGALALPLAAAAGSAFAAFVARVLNFEILTKSVPADTWIFLVASALFLPFLFAGPTLARASRITVRRALDDARGLPPSRGLRSGSWALRNLLRRPGRTLMTIGATALGVAIFATGFNMRESLTEFLVTTRDAMRFDLQVVLSTPMEREALSKIFQDLPGVRHSEMWVGGRGELQTKVARTDNGMGVVALPPDTRMLAPRMLDGRWLRVADLPEIVANQTAVETLRMPAVGGTIALSVAGVQRKVVLVGIIEEIDKAKIYLDEGIWDRWTGEGKQANTLCLVGLDRSYQGVMTLKRAVERVVESSDLKVLYVMSQAERTKIIADHLDIVLAVLTLLAFLVLGVSALGSASAVSITVMERTREIGVLRAIGAQPRWIIRLFVGEGMLTSSLGLLAGLVLSWPLSLVASSFFGSLMLGEGAVLRFALAPWGLVITAIVTLLFGWLASRLPARAALGISTRSALAYE